ncbi:aminoacetone oxidase family FAD-binding enzyme [Patescibacteria group bacterium]|nr:MAG: aminoacetone oxidase family FAD-binding enzyme [Patescibacteria group bacterium]
MKNQYDVIVIGGGASGMMAAGRAAERGKRVLLLEKNKNLGEKLKITGGGRCNITNAEESEHIFLSRFGKAARWLYSPFSQFGVKDTFSFFEKRGLPLAVEEEKRVFPKTEKAADVVRAFIENLKEKNAEIRTEAAVSGFLTDNNIIQKVIVSKEELAASSFILSTGGLSHPETGSTGDGFRWLEAIGHTVQKPTPDLVPIAVKDSWVKELSGITLSDAKITFFTNNQKKLSLKGKILFTHFGLSGPLILNASKKISDMLQEGAVMAAIDAFPNIDLGMLDKRITEIFDANKNKAIKNVFAIIAPEGTAKAILPLLKNIDPEKKVHSVTKEERMEMARLLKALLIGISGLMGYDKAIVVDGGLSLQEVDAKTMRSKLYRNLYITGDLLNINRPSGGYSLQLCWTTGHVAGSNA